MLNSDRLVTPGTFRVIDGVLVGAALLLAFYSADHVRVSSDVAAILAIRLTVLNLVRVAGIFLSWICVTYCFRVYEKAARSALSESVRLTSAIAITTLLLVSSYYQNHGVAPALHVGLKFALLCLIALFLVRASVWLLSHHSHSGLLGRRSVLIVGTGPLAVRAFRHLRTKLHRSHSLLGFVDCRNESLSLGEVQSLYLGHLAGLESILFKHVVDEVIIALPARSCYAEIEECVEICSRLGVAIQYPDDLFSFGLGMRGKTKPEVQTGTVTLRPVAHDARLVIKRFLDIVGAALGIIILSPLMFCIAVLVKCTSQGPAFFLQERYGLGRRRFRIVKFRTMVADAESKLKDVEELNEANGPIFKIRKDPRVTKIGAFLRRSSLDELPQLFNVFLGHMSLVGPRPMSVRDVSLFNQAWLMRRFSVKPGITCLWQVKGRSGTSFNRWIELDLFYIDNWSLGLDAKILALTIPAVVKGSGAM